MEQLFISKSDYELCDGDIILMHTGTDNTSLALPRILDSLGAKYRFCTVSELLVEGDFYVDNAGKMIKKS